MILAVDIGTTTCKAVVIDETCKVLDQQSVEYSFSSPAPGRAEQDPEDWWKAVCLAVRAVVSRVGKDRIEGVGLSGQMHGMVVLDQARRPLRPAILWNDQRSVAQCQGVYQAVGGREGLLALTNNSMLPGYLGGKLLWLRDFEPDNFAKAGCILLPKDYIRLRMTGHVATDHSDASGTGLFDVRTQTWATKLLNMLEVPVRLLPQSLRSTEVAGKLLPQAAEDLGLQSGLPVTVGGGDAVVQTVGAGTLNDSDLLVIIGTGGNVTISMSTCPTKPGPSTQVFCHVIPDRWVSMGVTLNAGNSLKWYRETFGAVAGDSIMGTYDALGREAGTSPPGAKGILFLPYLQGERSPHTGEKARGAFIGIHLGTRRADFVRSVLEGVAFSLLDVYQAVRTVFTLPGRLVVSGGGASSSLWLQIMADVFGTEVVTTEYGSQASALGAGMLAGVGLGHWKSLEEAAALVRPQRVLTPNGHNVCVYKEQFAIYKSLYPSLSEAFGALASRNLGGN